MTPIPSVQYAEWAVELSGHLNTWGKDALRGAAWYNHGAADFSSDISQGGWLKNFTNNASGTVKAWSIYANYEHFFTSQWRANESFGYVRISNPNVGFLTAELAGLEKTYFTNNLNVIYSPVPQTDFIFEWQHAYRQVGAATAALQDNGVGDQLDAQFKFYF